MPRALLAVLFLLLSANVLAWAGGPEPMRLPVDQAPIVFETRHGARALAVEIADTAQERERGLMFRREFPRDRAMLFVFPYAQEVTFWMQNTPLALDMVFVAADGRIVSIREHARPFSTDLIGSGGPVRFVVELDAGLARQLGLEKGGRVRHRVIDRIADEQ